jgi:hypothetical protein
MSEDQVAGALSPIGVTAPIPVMATRRGGWADGIMPKSHKVGPEASL